MDSLRSQLGELERKSMGENIWEDQVYAQSLMQQISTVREQISEVESLKSMLGDIDAAAEVAAMEVRIRLRSQTHTWMVAMQPYFSPIWWLCSSASESEQVLFN